MNLHEYQTKGLFSRYGIPVPRGQVADTPVAARAAFQSLGVPLAVVKAQIHAGGRGKGGGIKIVRTADEAEKAAATLLGKALVTHQTGPEGRIVRTVWVEAGAEPAREFYVGVVLDRKIAKPVLMASAEGGMDIEELAATRPEKILREPIHALAGLQAYQARRVAGFLGLTGPLYGEAVKARTALAKLYLACDATLVEINPLAVTKEGKLLALDGKLGIDDRSLGRQPDLAAMRDIHEEDPREAEAGKHGLSYISLSGNIGCMVNGAGLAMATMDTIQFHGGRPANFLDVGGGATKEQIVTAFKLLLANPDVKAVLINIFGGILKCDVLAQGIVDAVREVKLGVPLVVRLEGTNVDAGRRILKESGLRLTPAADMGEAARKVVEAARG